MNTKTYIASSRRGSALLAAILFTLILTLMVGSYLTLATSSLRMSHRSFHASTAMNLAELGIEEGLWSLNDTVEQEKAGAAIDYSRSFPGAQWEQSGANFVGNWTKASLTDVLDATTLKRTADAKVKVVYKPLSNGKRAIVARAVVDLPDNIAPVERWVEVRLSRSSIFSNGLLGKDGINFNGNNPQCDSWNSKSQVSEGKPYISYVEAFEKDKARFGVDSKGELKGHDLIHDDCPIATVAVTAAIDVSGAEVYGSASVGSHDEAAVSVGPNGLVGPFGTPDRTIADGAVSTDFRADLSIIDYNKGDYSPFPAKTLTNTLTPGVHRITSGITFGGGKTGSGVITIKANASGDPVILIIDVPEGQNAISITDKNSGIVVEEGAKVEIYTRGDIKISGQGIINNGGAASTLGSAGQFTIYGTSSRTTKPYQAISISGNGSLSAACYAPNADLTISGGGNATSPDVCGAYVARHITIQGNSKFHYDEALAEGTTGSPFAVEQWRELVTADDRKDYADDLKI